MSSFTGKVISVEGAEWSCFFVSSTGKGQDMIIICYFMFITLWPSKAALVLLDFNPTSFLFESTNELIYLGRKVLLVLFLSPPLAI